jgi:hypothetical protein
MITATEARKIADANNQQIFEQDMAKIEVAIHAAATKGLYTVLVPDYLSDLVLAELRGTALGFKCTEQPGGGYAIYFGPVAVTVTESALHDWHNDNDQVRPGDVGNRSFGPGEDEGCFGPGDDRNRFGHGVLAHIANSGLLSGHGA